MLGEAQGPLDIYVVSALINFAAFLAYALIGIVLIPYLSWPRSQKIAFSLLVLYDALSSAISVALVVFSIVQVGESPGASVAAEVVVGYGSIQAILGWTVFVYGMRNWS